MKTITKAIAATSAALLFAGCAGNSQPQSQFKFNKNNKSITFVEGKPYSIPVGGRFPSQALKKIDNDDKEVGCKKGYVPWMSDVAYYDLQATAEKYRVSVAKRHYQNGELGCSRPLSQQEYQYYLNQQNQQQANARAAYAQKQANSRAYEAQREVKRAQMDAQTASYYNMAKSGSANTYGSNSSTSNKNYFHSDGSSTTKIGNSYFNSDGSSTTKIGNSYFNSDGSSTTGM